jgi:uncharacterized membrane protein
VTVIREPGFDKAIALVLRIGAFSGFAIMLTGVVVGSFLHSAVTGRIETLGVEVMLITPLVRVFTSVILFTRGKEWRYSAISLGVLLILLLGAVFGIGEH